LWAGALPGKRQRLVVLRRSVKPFPCGKHCWFDSNFPDLQRLLLMWAWPNPHEERKCQDGQEIHWNGWGGTWTATGFAYGM